MLFVREFENLKRLIQHFVDKDLIKTFIKSVVLSLPEEKQFEILY
jgi:hypothetical protein